MNYWIFTVTTHRVEDEIFTNEAIFHQRMKDRFWGLGEKTPNRNCLEKGDQVVFYIGLPRKVFAGSAVLASDAFQLTEAQQSELWHGKKFYRAEYGVLLENIQIWDRPRPVEDLVPRLNFIENKEFWFAYFQGGVRQVLEEDFRAIAEGLQGPEIVRLPTPAEVQSASQFALETHLEEFVDRNWNSINFGCALLRYQTEDQSGRQFPAGPWSIDFLCTDEETGDFVVLELKRGKTSDSTVGQILRYMSWVKKSLAQKGQKVRGIIITREIDEALRYAVQDLDNVSVLTYRVDFTLYPFKKS